MHEHLTIVNKQAYQFSDVPYHREDQSPSLNSKIFSQVYSTYSPLLYVIWQMPIDPSYT